MNLNKTIFSLLIILATFSQCKNDCEKLLAAACENPSFCAEYTKKVKDWGNNEQKCKSSLDGLEAEMAFGEPTGSPNMKMDESEIPGPGDLDPNLPVKDANVKDLNKLPK